MHDPADSRLRPARDEFPPGRPLLHLVRSDRVGSSVSAAGLAGLLLSLVPAARGAAWPLLVTAVALGLVGVLRHARGTATTRGTSAVGMAMGWVGLVVLAIEPAVTRQGPVGAYYGP